MNPEEIKKNQRTEKAFRHFSGALMFLAAAVLAIIVLSAYLKFKPEIGEEITDGRLKQFLDKSFPNFALPKLALLSLVAGVLCFLPEKAAVVSLFASAGAVAYYFHVRECYVISPFPNGFLCVYVVFFGVSLCCAALRMKNRASLGKTCFFNELSALSSAIMLGVSAIAIYLDGLTEEYRKYINCEMNLDEVEERDFGDLELVVPRLELNEPSALIRLAIVFIFLALITLVLSRFPRLSLAAPLYGAFYSLYMATIDNIATMRLVFFFLALMAFACVASIPASLVTPEQYPDFDEFDENGSEDDGEDDGEYEAIKQDLEKKGLATEEF